MTVLSSKTQQVVTPSPLSLIMQNKHVFWVADHQFLQSPHGHPKRRMRIKQSAKMNEAIRKKRGEVSALMNGKITSKHDTLLHLRRARNCLPANVRKKKKKKRKLR